MVCPAAHHPGGPFRLPTPTDQPFPHRLTPEEFHPLAYRHMYRSRVFDERMLDLFQKGLARGTVTFGTGTEATAVAMALPFRPGIDPVAILHRDVAAHLIWGSSPYELTCQYMANAESPTHGREGNVHHGRAHERRFPMISHLGQMLSLVVGATWQARRQGEEVFGLAVIGDGGTSTGDFHESLNIASVRRSPVLFLIENNHYAFSVPTRLQYNCRNLSDRAAGYGIPGRTIDGTDAWTVYTAVCDALESMRATGLPYLLESICLRLKGHAAYDKGDYIETTELEEWRRRDPVPMQRGRVVALLGEAAVTAMEREVDAEIREAIERAVRVARPSIATQDLTPYAPAPPPAAPLPAFRAAGVRNGDAIRLAQEYLLEHYPSAFVTGMDIGRYGSAFKTTKGLVDRFGEDRVVDMPIAESGILGFALGASQVGGRPIVEYQFADFATESTTMLGLNAGTWYFRAGQPAPLVVRLPCGGGLTMGAFHSGEFEGLWSRFPGLKLLYPATPQESFEAILMAWHDPNPVLVFEHKLMYWSQKGDIDFGGRLDGLWAPRRHRAGDAATIIAFGATVHQAAKAVDQSGIAADVWNPFVLYPCQIEPLLESVRRTRRLIVVQESGETRGLGNHYISLLTRGAWGALSTAPELICPPDVPVPFAPELEFPLLPTADKIATRLRALCEVK
jgi:2-oxoisovalerate dehydrogenase E1 component